MRRTYFEDGASFLPVPDRSLPLFRHLQFWVRKKQSQRDWPASRVVAQVVDTGGGGQSAERKNERKKTVRRPRRRVSYNERGEEVDFVDTSALQRSGWRPPS